MERAISTILWILLLAGGAWGWHGAAVVLGLMALFEAWLWLRRTWNLAKERNRPCDHGVHPGKSMSSDGRFVGFTSEASNLVGVGQWSASATGLRRGFLRASHSRR